MDKQNWSSNISLSNSKKLSVSKTDNDDNSNKMGS